MKSQYLNTNGEVILSRWWRTASAKASVRRVEQDKKRKLRALRERMALIKKSKGKI